MPGDHAGDDGEGVPAVALQQCQNGASLFFIDMFIFSNIIRSLLSDFEDTKRKNLNLSLGI